MKFTALFVATALLLIVSSAALLVSAGSQMMPPCPAGQRAVQSELEITSNGCGVPGLHISMDGSDAFERPCCDLHDACYATCGSDRDECEKSFERCMDKYCARSSNSMQCKSAASTFSMGTKAMGSGAFKKSQEAACQCIDETDQQTIVDAYLPHAERIYRRALKDEEEIEDKIENFKTKVLPKYFSKKAEWTVLKNLHERYPGSIQFIKDEDKKKDL